MVYKMQRGLQITVQILSEIIALFVFVTLFFTKLNREVAVYDYTGKILLEDYVSNFLILIVVSIIVFYWMKKNLGKKEIFLSNRWKKQLLFASMLLLIIQIFVVYHIYFYAGFDAYNLQIAASNFVNGKFDAFYNLKYFQSAPNNLIAYMIYIVFYSLGKMFHVDGYVLLIGLNIVLANGAVVLSAVTAYKLTESKRIMWCVYGLSVLLYGISPWLSVPYTDMFSIIVPILSFYLYLCLREKNVPEVVKWFCVLIIPLLGYGIKPLNAIIAIAIVICELLYFKNTKKKLKKIPSFFVAMILIFCITSITQAGIEKYVGYQKDDEKVFSLSWVLFLGSDNSTYGQWSYENMQYASQFETKTERDANMLNVVSERLQEMGLDGYISHLMNKIHIFYGDGHIGWGRTGAVIAEVSEEKNDISHFLRNVIYPPENYCFAVNYPGYGDCFKYYTIIKQFIWLLILMFMIVGICRPTNDKRLLVLKVTWIGVFLFTMLFETHARLLISYLPIFVLIAGIGALQTKEEDFMLDKNNV